jgi:hypothetical protein
MSHAFTDLIFDQYTRLNKHGIDLESWGQLQRLIVLEIADENAVQLHLPSARRYFLALIQRVNATRDADGLILYKHDGPIDVADLNAVHCVVGRILDRDHWSIIDRSEDSVSDATFSAPNEDLL